MKLTELFLTELDREVERSRRALEQVPPGKFDWKPHEKSMIFGYLANMVATIPSWLVMEITQNELDVAPAGGGQMDQSRKETSDALIEALDRSAADARSALEKTSDEHLMKTWSLLLGGTTLFTLPRTAVLRTFVMNHIIHHRAQLGVYLRLNNIAVPAIYGPSADEQGM